MSAAILNDRLSVPAYLAADAQSAVKLDYYAGVVVAQAGASARHNLIVTNLIGHLFPHARTAGCRIFPSALRVQVVDQQVYTYPDLTVVGGTPQFADPTEQTLRNPTLIIEILSPSTERHDRVEKFQYYRQIPTLREYILIAQGECRLIDGASPHHGRCREDDDV